MAGGDEQRGFSERFGENAALALYVPAAILGPLTGVAPGSGIVGPRPCGTRGCPKPFVVYYEGDVHRTGELKTLADRAGHAAGRLRAEYPTVARTTVRAHDVVEVGVLYGTGESRGAEGQEDVRIALLPDAEGSEVRSRRLLAAWLEIDEASLDRELRASRGVSKKAGGRAGDHKKAG